MGMFSEYNTKRRADELDKDIADLEGLMRQKVEEPTESTEEEESGSPEEAPEVIAQQEEQSKEPVRDLKYWKDRCLVSEQRFNVTKPKYDSNIFKRKQENIELQGRVIKLSKSLNEANQLLASKKVSNLDKLMDEESVDVLGESVAGKMTAAIKETNDRVAEQERKLRDKELLDSERKLKFDIDSTYEKFMGKLNRLVPEQVQINNDPKFIEYLKGVDEETGDIRFDLFRGAESNKDAGRVAHFFNQFKARQVVPKDSVNKRIAPSTEGSDAESNINPDAGKMKMSFIKRFYHEVNKGKWKGRHTEKEAMVERIDGAMASGQIIMDA